MGEAGRGDQARDDAELLAGLEEGVHAGPRHRVPRDAGDGLPLLLRVSTGLRRRNPHQHDTRGLLELGELSVDAIDGVLDEIIGAERRQHADSGGSRPPFRDDLAPIPI